MLLYWPVRIIAFWHVPEKGPRACNSRGFLSMNKPFGMFPSLGSLPLFVRLPCIPTALQKRKQWVAWRAERRDGRWTKVPYDPKTGRMASSSDSKTWASIDEPLAYYE